MTAVFTPEQIREDGTNRVARTGVQSGLAGSVIVVAEWIAHQAGWHGDLPSIVAINMTAILTAAAAWWMNRKRISAQVEPAPLPVPPDPADPTGGVGPPPLEVR